MRTITHAALLAAFALAAACGRDAVTPAPQDRGTAPAPPAAAPSRERVYVSNETAGTVAIIDPGSGAIEATIPVGKRPRGLKVTADGRRLFVALSGSPIAPPGVDESTLPPADRSADGIGEIDLAARKVTRIIASGQDPEAFDLSPDGRVLYVSNEETAEMSVVDLAAGKVIRRVPVGEEPEGVTVSPDGKVVYVTCEGDHTVVAVDTTTFRQIARIVVADRPRAIAVTPDGSTLFVTGENAAAVSVVDARANTVAATIDLPKPSGDVVPPRPMGAVLSPDAATVYVSNGRAKSISVIDAAQRAVARTIADVGQRPWGIGLSADGRILFTANGPSGDVSFVDAASGQVTRRIGLGGSPWGVVVAALPAP